jgi:holliday junction resolvase YEN1
MFVAGFYRNCSLTGFSRIYGEIVGERVALSKLATDRFVRAGRPFRVAVDISIWQYQVQSSKGESGLAPALFCVCLELIGASV